MPRKKRPYDPMTELVEGKTYKYSELCRYFKEPQKSGDCKYAQFRRWRKYIEFTRSGTWMTLTKVYTPEEAEQNEAHRFRASAGAKRPGTLGKKISAP